MKTISPAIVKISAMFLAVIFFSACTKEGPAGPQGEQGLQGNKGDPGSANVKVFTKDITGATWATVGSSSAGYLKLDISAPQVLTGDVVNNWVTLVYVQSTDFSSWALLPYYTERNIQVSAGISVGHLVLQRSQEGKPSTQSNFYTVRLVCIEPSSTGPLQRTAASQPDFKDYNAVSAYYGIKE
jgi:hypothetical protein